MARSPIDPERDICPPQMRELCYVQSVGIGDCAMKRREFIGLIGAAAWPVAAHAQQKKKTVGLLNSASQTDWAQRIATFRDGLKEAGFVEGQNVELIYRFADYHYDLLPAMARDLASRGVDIIFASGGDQPLRAAIAATNTIPIVFTSGGDPVSEGFVESLNKPGRNVTGVTFIASALEAKRLEILHEIVPGATSIAVLMGSANTRTDSDAQELEKAAAALGVSLHFVKAANGDDLGAAFRDMVQKPDQALHIITDPFFAAKFSTLSALARAELLPATANSRYFATAGGLLSYGANFAATYRTAGVYAGRILKGELPAELPVQQSSSFELVINLKTAKALGITVPLSLLGRADEVIE
jgi:putative tryptophan/tyrosine transport system substrate-binding protein